MSLITDWFSVFQGPDQFRTLRNVKNSTIDTANSGLLSDLAASKGDTARSISDLSQRYSTTQPQVEANAAQEAASINDIYNGQFAKNLAAIRANRAQAMASASDRAIGYATRQRQNASMLRPGGGSSYFDRLALQQTGDINAKTAIDQADQEKQDYMAATNAQLSLAGRRNAITDATLQRILYPASLKAQALAQQTQELGGLTNIDNANDIYGVQKIQSETDKIGKLTDVSFNTLVALAGAYGAGAGGMGAMGGGGAAGGDIGAAGLSGAVGPDAAAGMSAAGETGAAAGAGGFNYGSFFSSLGKSAAGGGGGGGSSAIGSTGNKGWFSGFGGGRSGGGPMDAHTAYQVGEKGPEVVVPSGSTSPKVIAIGGMGSTFDDPYFTSIKNVSPNVVQIPSKGVPISVLTQQIKDAITEHTAGGRPVVAVGHSLGASVLRNVMNENLGGRWAGVTPMYLDPPTNTPWPRNPITSIEPSVGAINLAADSGIGDDPNTINWTGGKAIMYGPNNAHAPFAHPNSPGNDQRVIDFQNALSKNLGLTNRFSLPPADAVSRPSIPIPGRAGGGGVDPNQPYVVGEQGPEVIVPDQAGFVIPNYALNEASGFNETGGAPVNPTATPEDKKPGLPSKGAIVAEILRRIQSGNLQGNVGPAPTATPSGNDFSSVQGAMDRGVQLLGAQASERFHRANLLEEQAKKDRQDAMLMAQRIKEWNQQVQTQQENAATQKDQFAQSLAQNQSHIDAQMNRESGMDWLRHGQEATRQREHLQLQDAQANASDYSEAYQAVSNGQITKPEELGNFKHLLPEQIQRLTGYMGTRHRQDTEQDQAVTSIVAPIVSGIRTQRMQLAKTELAAEQAKWTFGTNKQDSKKVEQLKQAIATGEGLPLLPEAEWKKYLERLAKNPKISQLVNIDDKTQTVTPILKNPAAVAPAAPAQSQTAPGYDFGRTNGSLDIGGTVQPQIPIRAGSAAAAALGIPIEQTSVESLPQTPVRRYRYDPSTGKTVLIQ